MKKKPGYNVIVSDRAKHMLGAHIRFLAKVGPEAAVTTRKQLVKAIRSLADMPERFPFDDSDYITPNRYRRMFAGKWYLILYRVREKTVFVDYIVDCRQDYGWLVE